jgi:hypothetical protein
MALDRRTFLKLAGLKLAGGVWLVPGAAAVWEARELIRRGGVGRVVFCRASGSTAGWLRFLLDGAMPVCERIERDELVLCGTEATLVVDRRGYRRFA